MGAKYYYLVGGNPNSERNSGGGLISIHISWFAAVDKAADLIKQGYWNVRVITEDEFYDHR